MKLTNDCGLPDAIYQAVKNDPYTKGDADYSVTQLLKPPRMVALEREHYDELTEDASDRIWSLLGQVIHGILERAETEAIAERRWFISIAGKKISGGMDRLLLGDGLLQDYKFTTVWKFKDGLPPEFIEQLNCYAHILRVNSIDVRRLQIVGILRDWSKPEAKRNISYPRHQCILLDVPLWASDEAQEFIERRIALHESARIVLPLCSKEDRWAKPDIYAVMKLGAKRAISLHDDMIEAEGRAAALTIEGKGNYTVVKRSGGNTRCDSYCSVSSFCGQYKELCDQSRK